MSRAGWRSGIAIAAAVASLIASPIAADAAASKLHEHLYRTYTSTTATVPDLQRHVVYSLEPAGLVAVLNQQTGQMRTVVVGDSPSSLAVDQQSGDVYVANTRGNSVTVLRGDRILATVKLAKHAAPTNVLDDPHNHLVYVADTGDSRVSIIKALRLVAAPKVGRAPSGLTIDGSTVYVSDTGSGQLTMLDANRVVGAVDTGGTPTALASDPATHMVYALDPASSAVLVIRGTKLLSTVALREGAVPTELAVSSRTGTVVVLEPAGIVGSSPIPPGVAIIAGQTLVSETLFTKTFPTGLALRPSTGEVLVGTFNGTNALAIHGSAVSIAGHLRFAGVAVMSEGRFYAGTGETEDDAGILSVRVTS